MAAHDRKRVGSDSLPWAAIRFVLTLALALVPCAARAQVAASACPAGQEVNGDTDGHCCWPGQAWSSSRAACVGVAQCPQGFQASGESCAATTPACPPGQEINIDTYGHCCWPHQVWAGSRQVCIGIPHCPAGFDLNGTTCVAIAVAATATSTTPAGAIGTTPSTATTAVEPAGPSCEGGRVSTNGHCCWPAQRYSTTLELCAGIPTCPEGLRVAGEQCEPIPAPTPAPEATSETVAATSQPSAPTEVRTSRSPIGLVVAGVGVVSLIVGLGTWLAADSMQQSLRTECSRPSGCGPNARARANEIRTLDYVSNVATFGGAALAIAGGVLFLVVKREHVVTGRIGVTFDPSGGVGVWGRF